MAKPSSTPIIGVHLDLKGVAFKPSYIPQYLADLASQKVNTVLVEYEDVFPFKGIDIAYDKATVWSRATLARFQAEAKKHKIEVIPLQQCLGHLEYALGWDKHRRLAESYKYPSTIKVDDPAAVALIGEMLRQVMAAHPDSRYIHLGMDEAHSLHDAAKRLKRDVLDLFLDHLRVLLKIVEPTGKIPIIWTDMLEDHFRPDAFAEFRDRVIFGTWDYSKVPAETVPYARLVGGTRVSRTWLDEPENPAAPAIGPGTKFVEDHTPAIKRVLAPYRHGPKGRMFTPLFQIDLWTKLGLKVVPVSVLRMSSNLSVLPPYNSLFSNVRAWSKAVARTGQLGQIGSSWARGTSWCPPNFMIDLTWPVISVMARSMGAKPADFFPGIPPRTVDRIVRTLGRCREDWRLEGPIAQEMAKLAPRLRAHRYEWESLRLMACVMQLQRRAEYNILEVDYFHPNFRPVDSEWQRRLDEQAQTLRDLAALRRQVVKHFAQRYHGQAFAEWEGQLFGVLESRLQDCRKICRAKLAQAHRFYAKR